MVIESEISSFEVLCGHSYSLPCFYLLYGYLSTIINIYTLLRRLAAEAATIKVIPGIVMIRAIRVVRGCYSRFFVVAELQHDAAGIGVIGGETVQLEVGAEGIDAHGGVGPVELVPGTEIELGVVALRADDQRIYYRRRSLPCNRYGPCALNWRDREYFR